MNLSVVLRALLAVAVTASVAAYAAGRDSVPPVVGRMPLWRVDSAPGAVAPGDERPAARPEAVPDSLRAPAGVRVRVEVINTTKVNGLAKRAARYLRDRGFDVVSTGTLARTRDSTLVLDRSGHPDWADRVARSLGAGRAESRPDSSRHVDVTVLLGATWRPPAQPFHP